jgi:protein-ribulosamine 3-kinase
VTASLLAEIASAISAASGKPFRIAGQLDSAGGCINRSLVLRGQDGRRFFVKLNQAARFSMFQAESAGLLDLAAVDALRVPAPLTHGVTADQSFLVIEWLDLGRGGKLNWGLLGERLARLHRKTSHAFGWHRDNTIGSTPQSNSVSLDWVEFYRDQRLRPQLDLAARNGASKRLLADGEQLLAGLGAFFLHYTPLPSLLHGDLWSGNVATCVGEPVIFDPAVYFGDRETDLAMTELFGGFPAAFFAAYTAAWPLDDGYSLRKVLYQLYHLLNHFNLFGDSYARQSQSAIDRLLAELR